MGKGSRRRPGSNYEQNFEKIFGEGKKAVTSRKRFGNRDRENKSGVYIQADIEPFKSPITGEIISSRSQLRQHNKEHGVTNAQDYSGEFFRRKQEHRAEAIRGRTEADRRHRIEILREKMN